MGTFEEEDGVAAGIIFKIEPNGDLTLIAQIVDGKLEDLPKEDQATCKIFKIIQPHFKMKILITIIIMLIAVG